MSNTLLAMAISLIERDIDNSQPLEERLRNAMLMSLDSEYTWMLREHQERFSAGVLAVLMTSEDPGEKERVGIGLENLRALVAFTEGVPVDFEKVKLNENPIRLLKIWDEVTSGALQT